MAEEDVTNADSSSAEANLENADTAPVSGETQASDRPVQNIVAEFNRKWTKAQQRQDDLDRKIDQVLTFLASGQQAYQPTRQAAPTQGNAEITDEDLWRQAQQGNRAAFEEYQRRIAEREYTAKSQVDRKSQMVVQQLNTLVTKYPVLRDANHPLTQYSHQAYQLLIQNGYPATQETLLEAAKTAIADRPDLVSEIYSQTSNAREQVRQTAASRAQAGTVGASHRRTEPNQQAAAPKVTPQSADLAKRMGVKDPKAAKERFLKRQEQGQSSFGSVAAFVREDDF